MKNYIITCVFGICMGILGGCFGVGPSFGMPGLYLLGLVPNIKTAIGTITLASPATYGATYHYYLRNLIDFKIGIIFTVCFLLSAPVGSMLNKRMSDSTVYISMSVIHLIFSLIFMYLSYNN